MTDKILISVCMITYNHEKYIAQAIEGVLMQKTNFPIEIVIGEDCSTDGTREIVFNYEKKYPDIFRVITSEKNVGATKNSIRTFNVCKGKYIALCEGDDYWTDPYKLQKQVDFLEANPEYGMVHTDNSNLIQNTGKLIFSHKKSYYPNPPSGSIFNALLKKNFISTLTVVVKKDLIINASNKLKRIMNNDLIFDYALWLEISRNTKIKYLNEVTSVYRISINTISRPSSKNEVLKWKNNIENVRNFFLNYYHVDKSIIDNINYKRISQKLRLQYRKKEYSTTIEELNKFNFNPQNIKDRLLLFLYTTNASRIWYILLESPFIIIRKFFKKIAK